MRFFKEKKYIISPFDSPYFLWHRRQQLVGCQTFLAYEVSLQLNGFREKCKKALFLIMTVI